jgi:alpha-mannosidase
MKFDHLLVLLPCDSLEAFDLRLKEADAEQLLSAWSVLWHPILLAGARAIPRWLPAAAPPQDPTGHLIIVPDCCKPLLPEGWSAGAEATEACVIRHLGHRSQILAAALERLGHQGPDVDPDLAGDFLALGFCHFQVELLTRKLRYTSNLDEASLQTAALAAADEALKDDRAAAHEQLQSAFDRLHEARDYFYPSETRLLDLTVVAETTLGASLRVELAGGLPRNLLLSGEVIEAMARGEPETLEALRESLANNTAALVGGEDVEMRLPLLDPEAIEVHLRRGLAIFQQHLGRRPTVFGRRQFGLTPALPQIIDRLGFTGALHCTLDDGRFPTGNQSRIQWEGVDGTALAAIGCLPLDAGKAESFFRLAETLNNAMNLDQTSTVLFAHWPGRASPWYDDVRRIAAFGSLLGTFSTITDYFERTSLAGQQAQYQADQYRSPYLSQDVAAGRRDPISRWVRYVRRRAVLASAAAIETLAAVCGSPTSRKEGDEERRTKTDELTIAVEESLCAEQPDSATVDDELLDQLHKPLVGFAQSAVGSESSAERGWLLVNPWSFPQQACLDPSSLAPQPSSLTPRPSLVDVPAMGFAWVGPGDESPPTVERKGWFGRRKHPPPPPLAEENVLRNEFFEIQFDRQTGGIRTISDYRSRDPRLAQQIALRLPGGGDSGTDGNYSIMAADELTVTSPGPALGEIQSRGRLLDREGRRVAGFRQTTRAWRGSRILELRIELEIDRQPEGRPWESYYAVRFAWKDEAASLYRSVNMANLPTELVQFESPHYVDIRRDKQRTTLLVGGLPYHRRFGRRLDTLLVAQGETARQFHLGIGIDVPHPMSAALGFLTPPLVLPDQPRPPTPTGWLFHLDCRNVLATHWEPVCSPHTPCADTADGKAVDRSLSAHGVCGLHSPGFRVRLLETDGHGVRLSLRCFRAVASAHKINPGDAPPDELTVEGDRIDVAIGPHQWLEVEGRFATP